MTTDERAARLKDARERAGYRSARQAALQHGWKESTYRSHEGGTRRFGVDEARRYGRAFGVNYIYLLHGVLPASAVAKNSAHQGAQPQLKLVPNVVEPPEGDSPSLVHSVDATLGTNSIVEAGIIAVGGQEFTAIGRYDMAFSAGPGSLLDPQPEPLGFRLVETQWLRALTRSPADALAIVRVGGDSMEPTLCDSDWVLVDKRQTRISREGIYALHVYEDAWVKRLTLNLRDKVVKIISDNPRYPPQDMPEEDIHLIGRVIWVVARKIP